MALSWTPLNASYVNLPPTLPSPSADAAPLVVSYVNLPPTLPSPSADAAPLVVSYMDLPPPNSGTGELVPEAIEWVAPLASADVISPVVTYIYPGELDTLRVADPIIFSVVDSTGNLNRILAAVEIIPTGIQELVHDGLSFTSMYRLGSSRTAIENGFEYVVRRRHGWPTGTQIRVRVWAVDSAGNIEGA